MDQSMVWLKRREKCDFSAADMLWLRKGNNTSVSSFLIGRSHRVPDQQHSGPPHHQRRTLRMLSRLPNRPHCQDEVLSLK
ncbi:hypothetical protein D623_10018245 [Myotis brandtii]|uniref:Uncharacterized protein n=1 Tax=Myotis brandtii TaxID=109478 RepID=S7MUK8_MYOBR|nr:hypothetical protein D623_10018245 [Myotis brandtii]